MKRCRRCGGNLLHEDKGCICIQCGCEHNLQGTRTIAESVTVAPLTVTPKEGRHTYQRLHTTSRWEDLGTLTVPVWLTQELSQLDRADNAAKDAC